MALLPGDELDEDEELCASATPPGRNSPDISKPTPTTKLKRNVTTLF
jgi:hypothetical protein